MLATRGTTVPTGPEWLHEVKWDGMRVLVEVDGRAAADLVAQRERRDGVASRSCTTWPGLGHDVLLDGEVVAFADGVPTFGALADRMHVAQRAAGGRRWRRRTR